LVPHITIFPNPSISKYVKAQMSSFFFDSVYIYARIIDLKYRAFQAFDLFLLLSCIVILAINMFVLFFAK